MTIIVGIVCGDPASHIVLASDSQATCGSLKRCDARKITEVEFGDKSVLIAQAGSAELSSKAIDILEERAKGVVIADKFTVPRLAEESVREVRRRLVSLYEGQDFPAAEQERYFRDDNPFELMVAYWFEGKPYLCTVNISTCFAQLHHSHYHSIGCGANLADYILPELIIPNMPWKAAVFSALLVVEKVKQYDAYCGGPARLGIITPDFALVPQPEKTDQIVRTALEIEEKTKADRRRLIQEKIVEKSNSAEIGTEIENRDRQQGQNSK